MTTQVDVADEARIAQRRRTHPGGRSDVDRFEHRVRGDAVAGCHGGPGITFIPGYNAAYQVLDDLG